MKQSGWEQTPHKKKRKHIRGVPVEMRYVHQPETILFWFHDWHIWKWYPDLKTAKQALVDLQKSTPYSHINGLRQEFRIPDEYKEQQ